MESQFQEQKLVNALFFGAKLEVRMFECYDKLVELLPEEKLRKQAAAIRSQEANHLRLSAEMVHNIISSPLLSNTFVLGEYPEIKGVATESG